MHRTPPRTKNNTPPTKTRGQMIPETAWTSTICDYCHSVRQTNTWPAQLFNISCIQTPRPKASRNRRATGYPPRLVSTNPTCGTPPHPRQRTCRAPASLPRFCQCIQMGSRRSLVRRHKTTNPNRMVLRMASHNQEPILLGFIQKSWRRNYSRMEFRTPSRKSSVDFSTEWPEQSNYRITNAPNSSSN
jgi:hypothetical protein